MKSFYKVYGACLLVSIVFSMVTGCGRTTTTNSEVKIVNVWSQNSHSKMVYERLVNEFNTGIGKEKGVVINYEVKEGGTLNQTLEIALQSGDAPELFSGGNLEKMAENGDVVSYDKLPGGDEFVEKYQNVLRPGIDIIKGKVYTVPHMATTQGLIYNKDLFKKAGLVDANGEPIPPRTFAELREYAKKLTDKSQKQYGIILPVKWTGWFGSDISSPLMSSFGNMGYDPVAGIFDFSGLIPIIETFLGMREDGSIHPGAEGIDNDPARAQFATGNIGMKFGFSFDVGVLNDQFPAKCNWGVAPYPVVDENNKYLQRMSVGSSFYMNKKALDTVGGDKLMEVVKFFLSDYFISECYKEGVDLPTDWNLVKDMELKNPKKGWESFAQLTSISIVPPQTPKCDIGTQPPLDTAFINEVWIGSMKPSEFVEKYNKIYNDGVIKYYDLHPDENMHQYINLEWNIKR